MGKEIRLYYEAHINFARGGDMDLIEKAIKAAYPNWRIATFEMYKDREPTGFITGQNDCYVDLAEQMIVVTIILQAAGFKILRCKIEQALFDTKHGNRLETPLGTIDSKSCSSSMVGPDTNNQQS